MQARCSRQTTLTFRACSSVPRSFTSTHDYEPCVSLYCVSLPPAQAGKHWYRDADGEAAPAPTVAQRRIAIANLQGKGWQDSPGG